MKIGDKVKLTRDYTCDGPFAGEIGTVVYRGSDNCFVRKGVADFHRYEDKDNWCLCFGSRERLEILGPEVYLCRCEDGTYIAHEGSLDDLPSDVVSVWKPGAELEKTVIWKETQ